MVIRLQYHVPFVAVTICRKLIGVFLLIQFYIPAYAQSFAISGQVRHATNGESVPYVAVGLKNSANGTTADARGNFVLSLKRSNLTDTITLSALGYYDLYVPVKQVLAHKHHHHSSVAGSETYTYTFMLSPKRMQLGTVEINAKPVKWKERKVGYNIDKGITFQHAFEPLDTVLHGVTGQEIANTFRVRKYPVHLKDFNFGLHGSGNMPIRVRVRIYSLQNNLPHESLLSKDVVVKIPPHHTGWIRVNLERYNITLHQDFAVALEWINEANKYNSNSLMTFAKTPKDQVTTYRSSGMDSWKRLRTISPGMYVTVLHE